MHILPLKRKSSGISTHMQDLNIYKYAHTYIAYIVYIHIYHSKFFLRAPTLIYFAQVEMFSPYSNDFVRCPMS